MKKVLVVVLTIAVCSVGYIGGYLKGHETGEYDGFLKGQIDGRESYERRIEQRIRDNKGYNCTYYGTEGIEVMYKVVEK